MSQTLSPRACDPNQWKVWVRDGAKIYVRSLSSWGLLWCLLYLAIGWISQTHMVACWLFMGLSGVFQHMHAVTFEQMREGQVGWLDVWRNQRALFRDHGRHLIQNFILRFGMSLGLTLAGAVASLVIHALAGASHPPASVPATWWTVLGFAGDGAALVAGWTLWLQIGGPHAMVLNLVRHHPDLDTVTAARLDTQAYRMNHVSMFSLLMLWSGIWFLLVSMLPFLVVVAVPMWLSVLSCAYADIFEDGYQIKALDPLTLPRVSLRPRLLRVGCKIHAGR